MTKNEKELVEQERLRLNHLLDMIISAKLTASDLSNLFETRSHRYGKTLNILYKELRALEVVGRSLRGDYSHSDWKGFHFDVSLPQSGRFFWGHVGYAPVETDTVKRDKPHSASQPICREDKGLSRQPH